MKTAKERKYRYWLTIDGRVKKEGKEFFENQFANQFARIFRGEDKPVRCKDRDGIYYDIVGNDLGKVTDCAEIFCKQIEDFKGGYEVIGGMPRAGSCCEIEKPDFLKERQKRGY